MDNTKRTFIIKGKDMGENGKKKELLMFEQLMMWILFTFMFIASYILFDGRIMRAMGFVILSVISAKQMTDWFHGK